MPPHWSFLIVAALLVKVACGACSSLDTYSCMTTPSCYLNPAGGCSTFTSCTAVTDSPTCISLALKGCVYMSAIPNVIDVGCYPALSAAAPTDNFCSPLGLQACTSAAACYFTTIISLMANGYPSVTTPCIKFTTCDAVGADVVGCVASYTHGCKFQKSTGRCSSGGNVLTPPATPVPTVACESMSVGDCTATDRCYYQSGCKTFTTCESLGASCSVGIRQLCMPSASGQCYTQVPPPAEDSTCGRKSTATCSQNTNCYVPSFSSLSNGVLVEKRFCRRFSTCAAIGHDASGCYSAAMRGCVYYNEMCQESGQGGAPVVRLAYGTVRFGGNADVWESLLTANVDSLESLLKAQFALCRGISPNMVTIFGLRTGSLVVDVAIAESNVAPGWTPSDVIASVVASNATMSNALTSFLQTNSGSTQTASMLSATNTSAPPPSPLDDDGGSGGCDTGCIAGAIVGSVVGVAILVGVAVWWLSKKNAAAAQQQKNEVETIGVVKNYETPQK